MNVYEQIVRDLANGFSLCDDDRCHWCRATFPRPAGGVVGIQHKPECLIQRARNAVQAGNPEREKEITVTEKKQLTSDEGIGQWVEETPLYLYSDGSVRWKP